MATLADALVAAVETVADAEVEKIHLGHHWSVVCTRDGRMGMASSLPSQPHCDGQAVPAPPPGADAFIGRSTRSLALAHGADVPESVRSAALNALLSASAASAAQEINGKELLFQRAAGKTVVVVGGFPFTARLRELAAACHVLELRARPGELDASEAPRVLPTADVVAITASAVVNGTISGLLPLCRPDAYVVVLGQSCPLHPCLFQHGVSAIAGAIITDYDALVASLSDGSCAGMQGIRKVVVQA